MRSALILAALALPVAAASAAPAPQLRSGRLAVPSTQSCRTDGPTYAGRGKIATRPQKLGELPPANHYLAVVRQVGGCPEPAIVRTGVGGR